jgi:hypothetical protein
MLLLVAPLLVAVQRQETHRQKGERQVLPFVPLAFARLRAKVIFIRIAELKTRTAKARVGRILGQLKSDLCFCL